MQCSVCVALALMLSRSTAAAASICFGLLASAHTFDVGASVFVVLHWPAHFHALLLPPGGASAAAARARNAAIDCCRHLVTIHYDRLADWRQALQPPACHLHFNS